MAFLEFDNYRIDTDHHALLQDGQVVHLQPKVVETLLVLAESAGQILSKEELMERLWPETYVEEANLKQNIFLLRKALGDDSGQPRYIETIPRRGYRFLVETRIVDEVTGKGLSPSHPREQDSNPPRPEPPVFARPVYIVIAIAVVIMAAVFLVSGLKTGSSARPSVRRLTKHGDIRDAAISRDGRLVAYVSKGDIWTLEIATHKETLLTGNQGVHYRGINFSPDGNYIYYARRPLNGDQFTLYRIPVNGGTQEEIFEWVDSQVSFSPDGSKICFWRENIFTGENFIMVSNPNGMDLRTLITYKSPEFVSVEGMDWTPDGKKIVYPLFITSPKFYFRIMSVDAETGATRQIGDQNWGWLMRVVWGKDGREVIFSGRKKGGEHVDQLWRLPIGGGEAVRILNDFGNYANPSLSYSRDRMVTIEREFRMDLEIITLDRPGDPENITQKPASRNGYKGIDWTPDGRIVYPANENGYENLWIMNSDGSGKRKITEDSDDDDHFPSVSADGKHIAFISQRSGPLGIWRIDLDGGNRTSIKQGNFDMKPNYSHDGKWLVFSSEKFGVRNIYKISLDQPGGGRPVRLTTEWTDFPAISPDSRLIACNYRESSSSPMKIAIISIDNGAIIRLLDIPTVDGRPSVRWHPSGKALCYLDPADRFTNIRVYPLDGRKQYRLTNYTSDRIYYYAWSRDGRSLAISRGRENRDVVLIEGIY